MKKSGKYFLILSASLAVAGLSGAALAFNPPLETIDARAMALGGATTSLFGPLTSVRSNPAGLAPERGFFGGATYLNRRDPQYDAVSVTIVDNNSSPFAGALQYFRLVTKQETEDIGLSLAAGAGKDYYWGATVRYVHGRDTRDESWDGAFVGDVGVLVFRENGLHIGIAARDLFATTFDMLDPRAALGVSYNLPKGLLATADFTRSFDHEFAEGHRFGMGLEWTPVQTHFALRAGQVWDAGSNSDAYSVGLGWRKEGMEFGYAFQRNRQNSEEMVHVFTLGGSF